MTTPDPHFIDSLNHPTAHLIQACLHGTLESPHSHIIVEDLINIEAALKQKMPLESLITSEREQLPQALITLLQDHNIPIIDLKPRTAKKLFAATRLPKHFALCPRPSKGSLTTLPSAQDLLVLDGIAITGNIGAICRTATAFDVAAIVIVNASVDPYDRRIIRASRGHVFRCPVVVTTPDNLLAHCASHNIDMVATAANAPQTVAALSAHPQCIALMMGEEKTGLDDKLQNAAKLSVKIPMKGSVESLNVSVAAGICLYERRRQSDSGAE